MREPLWQRVRRHRNTGEADARDDARPTGSPAARATNQEVVDQLHHRSSGLDDDADRSMLDGLTGLDASGDKRAEYADWAERMKAKRAEKVDSVRQLNDDAADARPSYWSADAVWEESRRLESEGAPVVVTRLELLAVLGLGGDATSTDIVATYRQRAKEHHPDRFPHADEATRAYHVEQMQRITAAYRALQPGPRS